MPSLSTSPVLQIGFGVHLPSCNTSVGLQVGAGTHLPFCNTSVGLQVIGPNNGGVTTGGVTICGPGGVIVCGPWGVVVIVVGLDNAPGCGGRVVFGGGDVSSELASGLLVLAGVLPPLDGGGLLLLLDGLSLEGDDDGVLLLSLSLSLSLSFDVEEVDGVEDDDVSAYTIVVATEPLTINTPIIRKNPKWKFCFLFMISINHSLPASFVLGSYLREFNKMMI